MTKPEVGRTEDGDYDYRTKATREAIYHQCEYDEDPYPDE